MSIRPSNSVIVALYRDASCLVELKRTTPLPGYSTVSGDSPEDSSISGATACMI